MTMRKPKRKVEPPIMGEPGLRGHKLTRKWQIVKKKRHPRPEMPDRYSRFKR